MPTTTSSRKRPRRHQLVVFTTLSLLLQSFTAFTPSHIARRRPLLYSVPQHELDLGKALDTLQSDYSHILVDNPDFSIYDPNIQLTDPSGVTITGKENYKAAFSFLHGVLQLFYCPEKSQISFRILPPSPSQIKIHWNVELRNRVLQTTQYIDGISVYELKDSQIVTHKVERLLYNQTPLQLRGGVLNHLRNQYPMVAQFQSKLSLFGRKQQSALFSETIEQQLERQNKSRQKFGLKPLNRDEFLELQDQIEAQKAALPDTVIEKEEPRNKKKQSRLFGFLDTCETHFDCERPEFCCDFGISKRCCANGTPILARVPIDVRDSTTNPQWNGGPR